MQVYVGRSSHAHDSALTYAQGKSTMSLWNKYLEYTQFSQCKELNRNMTSEPSHRYNLALTTKRYHIHRDSHLKHIRWLLICPEILLKKSFREESMRKSLFRMFTTLLKAHIVSEGISTLLSYAEMPCYVCWDFNSRYLSWDSSNSSALSSCSDLIEW